VLEVTDRIVVLRLGRVVRDAPTADFDVNTLLGTITGLIGGDADPGIEAT
jgi:simple sugar transport system ATP-binding protein